MTLKPEKFSQSDQVLIWPKLASVLIRAHLWTPQNWAFSYPTLVSTPPEWPSQEVPGFSLTSLALVSDVSAPAWTNRVWPPLKPVSVAQKNKPLTMSSSNVQSTDLFMYSMAWRFWTMRQLNGCSTPAPKSSAGMQWIQELTQKKRPQLFFLYGHFLSLFGVFLSNNISEFRLDRWQTESGQESVS